MESEIHLKIKNNKIAILVIIFLTISLIGGFFDLFLNSPIPPNNIIINDEVNNKIKNSAYSGWQTIWGTNIDELGDSVGIDTLGNVYITGRTHDSGVYNGLVVSFEKYGTYRWNVTWGDGGIEWGYDIAIDSMNNIYVAGKVWNGSAINAIILKPSFS